MDYAEFKQQVETRRLRPPRKRHADKGRDQGALLADPQVARADRLRELLPVARALVAAALNNHDIREHINARRYGWTEEGQRRDPTVRVEFEYALVIGHTGEGLAIGSAKDWGPVLGVFPLEPGDPVDPSRVLFLFKEGNRYQRRFDQRRYLKERLGKAHAPLVNRAMGSTLAEFSAGLTATDVVALDGRLKLTVREFWRAARGASTLAVPTQRSLFDRAAGGADDGEPAVEIP